MKIKKEDIPVIMEAPGTIMRKLEGFGNMDAIYHELPEGTDFTPLLKGLPNDSCHCPHWVTFSKVRFGLFMMMEPKRYSRKEMCFSLRRVIPQL